MADRTLKLLAAFLLCVCLFGANSRAQEPARYKLVPGQVLEYRSAGDVKYSNHILHDEYKWTVYVVRQIPDGGWHLVVRVSQVFWNITPKGEKDTPKSKVQFLSFDLSPLGVASPTTDWEHASGYEIFPALPRDEQERRAGWTQPFPAGEYRYTAIADPAEDQKATQFLFQHQLVSGESDVYLIDARESFRFDRGRGLVSSGETTVAMPDGKGAGKVALKSSEMYPMDWIDAFGRECDACMAARAAGRPERS